MRTTHLSTTLDAPADVVWAAVATPGAFRLVTRGLLDWRPARRRHDRWHEGEEHVGWLLLGGVVPVSRHRLRVERLDDHARLLRSDEGGGLVRSWSHDIVVEPLDDGRCRYTDRIEIDAGPLTPLVWAFAEGFYRVRQRRWRELARILGAAGLRAPDRHAATAAAP
jgi:hypothetical protein